MRVCVLAITSQQQQAPCLPFLRGVIPLIHQILLDADVPCQRRGQKAVGEREASRFFR
jgi:hypothetical protein